MISKVPSLNSEWKRSFKTILKHVDDVPIYDWANNNIFLPSSYAIPGRFDISRSKYLIEPFISIKNNKVRTVVIYASVQSGKTLTTDITIAWYLINKPGPIQLSMANDIMVSDHLNNRLYPLLQSCDILRPLLPENDKSYTDRGLRLGHSTLYANGASLSKFQAKSIQLAICDEAHLWNKDRNKKYALLSEAIDRTSAYERQGKSKVIITSRPSEVGDQLDVMFNSGNQMIWNVPCLGCGKYFSPVFRRQRNDGTYYGILFENIKDEDGNYKLNELLDTIRYECEYCGFKHFDNAETKSKWNDQGKFISNNVNHDPSIHSYRWNAIPVDSWRQLTLTFLNAKQKANIGVYTELTDFFQQKMAEPFDLMKYIDQENKTMKVDVYDTKTDWAEEVTRFATIDMQKYCFYLVIRAWAKSGASRQLFAGAVNTEEVLLGYLTDYKVNRQNIFVDIACSEKSEDGSTHEVYNFVNRNGFTGLRGDAYHDYGFDKIIHNQKIKVYYSDAKPIPTTGRIYYDFSPHSLRDILKNLRDGKSHEYKCLDNEEYKKQMFAEARLPVKDKYGQIRWRWINKHNKPNHFWDCEVMQLACVFLYSDAMYYSNQHDKVINVIPKIN